jgi:hypothetical protein
MQVQARRERRWPSPLAVFDLLLTQAGREQGDM